MLPRWVVVLDRQIPGRYHWHEPALHAGSKSRSLTVLFCLVLRQVRFANIPLQVSAPVLPDGHEAHGGPGRDRFPSYTSVSPLCRTPETSARSDVHRACNVEPPQKDRRKGRGSGGSSLPPCTQGPRQGKATGQRASLSKQAARLLESPGMLNFSSSPPRSS